MTMHLSWSLHVRRWDVLCIHTGSAGIPRVSSVAASDFFLTPRFSSHASFLVFGASQSTAAANMARDVGVSQK